MMTRFALFVHSVKGKVFSLGEMFQGIDRAEPLSGSTPSPKQKNRDLGSGVILKMNSQYLTVSFPVKNKNFELLTATAEEFLAPARESA